MLSFGRAVRWKNDFKMEVDFSRANGFDFLQVWYYKGNIVLDTVNDPKELALKECGFPVIIHALLDINEFDEHVSKIIKILKLLEHKEVIIHPVCTSEEITEKSVVKLAEKVSFANRMFLDEGIVLMLENNSKLDPIHYKTEEIRYMFTKNLDLEFLLDIAHIDNYEHLKEMVDIKRPRMLHIADKRFSSIHEHLSLGKGEIDFEYIFREVLNDFDGKIVFEVTEDDENIVCSKNIILSLLGKI